MEHLSVARLIALSIEGSVTDSVESQHLRNCYQWLNILRRFAEQRRKAKQLKSAEASPES